MCSNVIQVYIHMHMYIYATQLNLVAHHRCLCPWCRLEKNFQMRQNERRMEFIRVGDTAGWLKRGWTPFVASFYSLQKKKTSVGRVALDDWLGC